MKALLQQLGLSEGEIAVYSIVVQQRKATPALIARLTKINRPTVYNLCKKLVARGFLVEDLGDKTLKLTLAPPTELKLVMKKDEEELIRRQKLVGELAEELLLIQSSATYPVPKVRFIGQDRLEQYLYTQAPVWDLSIARYHAVWWGFQDHTFVEHYKEWIDWYWKQASPKVQLYLLSNAAKVEDTMKGKYERRHIKPWNKGEFFTASTWVLGDYLVMIITDKEPFYLVEIHDERMAHNFRELFKNIWGLV